ncbi:MAG TPA: sodium:calcium antiporter, partial [Clostridia bacterium]|nr:sodium:calcium antiporter [Clostridia bacterium]
VSLGTTLPELSSSVIATIQGAEGFALGNAIGSCVTNTSLILGIGALVGKIPVDKVSSKKVTIFVGAALLLILPTIPYRVSLGYGLIPQWMGLILVLFMPVYVFILIKQEKNNKKAAKLSPANTVEGILEKPEGNIFVLIVKVLLGAFIVTGSASVLVDSATIMAVRMNIPEIVISSTLVAFGTSVPELTTVIAASKKGSGGLALGNVFGANTLNILMVIGASAMLSPGGMKIPNTFYLVQFMSLGVIMLVFGVFAYNKKFHEISKREGIMLIGVYSLYLGANVYQALG